MTEYKLRQYQHRAKHRKDYWIYLGQFSRKINLDFHLLKWIQLANCCKMN